MTIFLPWLNSLGRLWRREVFWFDLGSHPHRRMNQSYCPSPMKNCLMMMTLLEKDVKYLSNVILKYLPSGVGGLGFLGCSGGFLGFIDSSISFSLSAAAFSFISKSFRLFSTLIFSFVANSLRKNQLQTDTTPGTPDRSVEGSVTHRFLSCLARSFRRQFFTKCSSARSVIGRNVSKSISISSGFVSFSSGSCFCNKCNSSVRTVVSGSGQVLGRLFTWIIETTLHNLSLGNLFMSSDSFRFSS